MVMKLVTTSAIAFGLSIVGSQAHAQNSMTLYGIVDTGIQYVHNNNGQSTQIALTSGNDLGTRLGFKGEEDLGGNLKAIFRLENGYDSTNGGLQQGNRMFGRQAFVGLSGDTWGTITAGRQYDPLIDLVQPLQGDFFKSPGDIDNSDNSIRINNSVKWTSPVWSHLQFDALYSFGGIPGSVGSGQTYSAAAGYTTGAFGVAAGFLHIDNGNTILSTRATSSADSLFNSSVNDAYASASSVNITRVAANYTIGSVVLGGYYSFSEYVPDASSTFSHAEKYNNVQIYGQWIISPSIHTQIGYDYMRSSGDSSAKQNQLTLNFDYFASKRTDLYAALSYAHASGTNGEGAAQAVIGSTDINSGARSQALIVAGIRHAF
jgi:predicted porin